MFIPDYIIEEECSIIQAMRQIDQNTKGIVYVVRNKMLIGAITDGDIRRFVLRGGNLNDNAASIANISPKYLREGEEKKAGAIMEKYKIRSLPILDAGRHIVRIIFDDTIVEAQKEELNIPVVIMAGGKGTRLYPYTQVLPKPLIPIGDKTITEHIMDNFEKYGCTSFTMIVNYKKNFIKSYFLDNERGYNVDFLEEKQFLGTGGGLKLLKGKIKSTIFMTNCDILIEEDYAQILKKHRENRNLVTIVCAVKNMTIPYGTVELKEDGTVLGLKEKPELSFITNTGLYVIEPEFIELIPDDTFIHITDIIQKCIDERKKVGVYKISEEKWLDMGQIDELERMKKKLNVE